MQGAKGQQGYLAHVLAIRYVNTIVETAMLLDSVNVNFDKIAFMNIAES